ncbi:3447_t:CDS:1, partial [Funneliformis geosporum]
YGIRHLTSKKEDRQNNPEIELNEAQFIALERNKRREREKSIKEAEEKKLCPGEHILTYGTAFESREEKALEVEELKEVEQEQQRDTKALSESKEEAKPIKEILIEKK